jgi:hypothetical protein
MRAHVTETDRVSVGLGILAAHRADRAAGAGHILDHDALAKLPGHDIGHDAPGRIGRTTGGKRHDQRHVPLRIGLCPSRCSRQDCCKHSAADLRQRLHKPLPLIRRMDFSTIKVYPAEACNCFRPAQKANA